jgi:hypothetical protein
LALARVSLDLSLAELAAMLPATDVLDPADPQVAVLVKARGADILALSCAVVPCLPPLQKADTRLASTIANAIHQVFAPAFAVLLVSLDPQTCDEACDREDLRLSAETLATAAAIGKKAQVRGADSQKIREVAQKNPGELAAQDLFRTAAGFGLGALPPALAPAAYADRASLLCDLFSAFCLACAPTDDVFWLLSLLLRGVSDARACLPFSPAVAITQGQTIAALASAAAFRHAAEVSSGALRDATAQHRHSVLLHAADATARRLGEAGRMLKAAAGAGSAASETRDALLAASLRAVESLSALDITVLVPEAPIDQIFDPAGPDASSRSTGTPDALFQFLLPAALGAGAPGPTSMLFPAAAAFISALAAATVRSRRVSELAVAVAICPCSSAPSARPDPFAEPAVHVLFDGPNAVTCCASAGALPAPLAACVAATAAPATSGLAAGPDAAATVGIATAVAASSVKLVLTPLMQRLVSVCQAQLRAVAAAGCSHDSSAPPSLAQLSRALAVLLRVVASLRPSPDTAADIAEKIYYPLAQLTESLFEAAQEVQRAHGARHAAAVSTQLANFGLAASSVLSALSARLRETWVGPLPQLPAAVASALTASASRPPLSHVFDAQAPTSWVHGVPASAAVRRAGQIAAGIDVEVSPVSTLLLAPRAIATLLGITQSPILRTPGLAALADACLAPALPSPPGKRSPAHKQPRSLASLSVCGLSVRLVDAAVALTTAPPAASLTSASSLSPPPSIIALASSFTAPLLSAAVAAALETVGLPPCFRPFATPPSLVQLFAALVRARACDQNLTLALIADTVALAACPAAVVEACTTVLLEHSAGPSHGLTARGVASAVVDALSFVSFAPAVLRLAPPNANTDTDLGLPAVAADVLGLLSARLLAAAAAAFTNDNLDALVTIFTAVARVAGRPRPETCVAAADSHTFLIGGGADATASPKLTKKLAQKNFSKHSGLVACRTSALSDPKMAQLSLPALQSGFTASTGFLAAAASAHGLCASQTGHLLSQPATAIVAVICRFALSHPTLCGSSGSTASLLPVFASLACGAVDDAGVTLLPPPDAVPEIYCVQPKMDRLRLLVPTSSPPAHEMLSANQFAEAHTGLLAAAISHCVTQAPAEAFSSTLAACLETATALANILCSARIKERASTTPAALAGLRRRVTLLLAALVPAKPSSGAVSDLEFELEKNSVSILKHVKSMLLLREAGHLLSSEEAADAAKETKKAWKALVKVLDAATVAASPVSFSAALLSTQVVALCSPPAAAVEVGSLAAKSLELVLTFPTVDADAVSMLIRAVTAVAKVLSPAGAHAQLVAALQSADSPAAAFCPAAATIAWCPAAFAEHAATAKADNSKKSKKSKKSHSEVSLAPEELVEAAWSALAALTHPDIASKPEVWSTLSQVASGAVRSFPQRSITPDRVTSVLFAGFSPLIDSFSGYGAISAPHVLPCSAYLGRSGPDAFLTAPLSCASPVVIKLGPVLPRLSSDDASVLAASLSVFSELAAAQPVAAVIHRSPQLPAAILVSLTELLCLRGVSVAPLAAVAPSAAAPSSTNVLGDATTRHDAPGQLLSEHALLWDAWARCVVTVLSALTGSSADEMSVNQAEKLSTVACSILGAFCSCAVADPSARARLAALCSAASSSALAESAAGASPATSAKAGVKRPRPQDTEHASPSLVADPTGIVDVNATLAGLHPLVFPCVSDALFTCIDRVGRRSGLARLRTGFLATSGARAVFKELYTRYQASGRYTGSS